MGSRGQDSLPGNPLWPRQPFLLSFQFRCVQLVPPPGLWPGIVTLCDSTSTLSLFPRQNSSLFYNLIRIFQKVPQLHGHPWDLGRFFKGQCPDSCHPPACQALPDCHLHPLVPDWPQEHHPFSLDIFVSLRMEQGLSRQGNRVDQGLCLSSWKLGPL